MSTPVLNVDDYQPALYAAPDSAPIVDHVSATHRGAGDRFHGLIYSGADAHLVEPVDPEVFVGTIKRLLDARSE